MKRAHALYNVEYIVGGIGSTFRRSALEAVGGYDTDTMTEDIDLTMKLLRIGNRRHTITYADDVRAYTESVPDFAGLIRQRFRWKYGRCQTFLKNASIFFSHEPNNSRWLTWVQLPHAVFSEFAFLFEPFLIAYILWIVIIFDDWLTLVSALTVLASYFALAIVSDVSLTIRERAVTILCAPLVYGLFFVLTTVEYIALIKSVARLHSLKKSIQPQAAAWTHVVRSPGAK